MMQMREVVEQANQALRHNRSRTMLTMFGMAWGIATVVLLLAYGDGFGRAVNTIFASFGMRVMGVFPGRTSQQAGGNKAGAQIRFTLEDIERISTNIPQITNISPEVGKDATVTYEGRSFSWYTRGNYPNSFKIYNLELAEGRFYNNEDMFQKARVVVLGSEAREKLFSGRYCLGETIRVDGIPFLVIGVLKPKMQEGDDNINRILDVPFTTMSELKDTKYLNGIWLNYESDDFEQIERGVRQTLAQQYHFNPGDRRAVHVFSSMKQLNQFNIITMGLKVLLAFIGTLTLGIGGIGLMNIMLVAVTQRTREIGIEKALGARRRDILWQFLAEAMAITFAGGLLGVALAYAVSLGVGTLTLYSALAKHGEAGDIRLIISPMSILIATGILGAVGLVSGMVPAVRASRLDPIEALRYE